VHWSEIEWDPSPRKLRQFGAIGFAALVVLAILTSIQGRAALAGYAAALAMAVGTLAIQRPTALRLLFVGLIVVGFPVGWTVSHLLLALVYFGLVTPLGWSLRLLGRDSLRLKAYPAQASFWEARPPGQTPDRYLYPY
jgi:hypothetical protein